MWKVRAKMGVFEYECVNVWCFRVRDQRPRNHILRIVDKENYDWFRICRFESKLDTPAELPIHLVILFISLNPQKLGKYTYNIWTIST